MSFGGANDGYETDKFGSYAFGGKDTLGRPYYKHESSAYYMYLTTWMGKECWFIGDGGGAASWYASKGTSSSPADATNWTVYNDDSSAVAQSGVAASCAGASDGGGGDDASGGGEWGGGGWAL